MALSELTMQRAKMWATSAAFDQSTREEVQRLIDDGNSSEINDRFYRDLDFGTGGLRGVLGSGSAFINKYNIRRASYALGSYLQVVHGARQKKVAVSYDSRRMSREFAEETCATLYAMGIEALITKDLRPVPMLSYMVRYYGCDAGVCITASHNPPEYNGFKVYWSTGGQLVPPHDQGVIDCYYRADPESLPVGVFMDGLRKGKIHEVGGELDDAYFKSLRSYSVGGAGQKNLKIVYTPIHGSGGYPVQRGLQEFGFSDVNIVKEQLDPNGDFPTVDSPNPESAEALSMAVKYGKKLGADLVLGTDPDADRVGVVVKVADGFEFLNGNQLGSLLIDFILKVLTKQGRLPDNPLVVKTIVTTDLQAKIAEAYGVECEETLTGFKWICDLIDRYSTKSLLPQKNYVCGGEESYGFLAGTDVMDKDAVQACCLVAEMAFYYKSVGKTLIDALGDLHRKHGVYLEDLKTITLPGQEGAERILEIMQRLRSEPPREICGQKVVTIRDFQKRQELNFTSNESVEASPLELPKSNVLQYLLEDGTKVSARPSGTEPKIKFYVSVNSRVAREASAADMAAADAKNSRHLDELMAFFESVTN